MEGRKKNMMTTSNMYSSLKKWLLLLLLPWNPVAHTEDIRQNFYLKRKQYLKGCQWMGELSGRRTPHSDKQQSHTAAASTTSVEEQCVVQSPCCHSSE